MSKKQIPLTQKSINNWNGRYPRAMETDTFVFFVKFDEGDENGNTFMYRKRDNHLQLVSDNYFASVGLMDAFRDGEEIWMSPAMKKERALYVQEVILPLVKEYVELSHKCDLGERFNELESEIEEYYVTLPEEDVCMFLEEKFAEYL
jgi:hypothetical protein